jgi:hypothetical protein
MPENNRGVMAKCLEVKEILPPKSGLGTCGKKQGETVMIICIS